MTNSGAAPPVFKLLEPSEYFGLKTLEMVQAALAGDEPRVRHLLSQGADPNEAGPKGKENQLRPLHYAVSANNTRAVQLLVGAGADPEADTSGPGSPLLFSILLDSPAMLTLLLELKPVARLSPQTVQTLFFRTAQLPRPRCLSVFLQRGVSIDLPDSIGATVFMEAMASQNYDLAEWILQQGAAVTRQPSKAGFTPANVLQFHLGRIRAGTPSHQRLTRIKELMQTRGAEFPAPTPQEVRALRVLK